LTSQLTVSYPSGQYPLYVGWDLLKNVTELIPLPGSYVTITDKQVNPLYGHFIGKERPSAIIELPEGEEHKNLDSVRYLYQRLLESEMDRSSTIVALGGGVVGDTAGFAAATYMRGIGLIQCPTTLLAMVDASIGGKTGVDLPQGKNLVGAFKQPVGVVTDLEVLQTLPAEQFRSGMAEVVKHGLIASPRLLKWIEDGWWQFDVSGNNHRFQALIVEAISVKKDIIQKDPFENNVRAHLNLGHTFAHAIESVSNFEIGHGFAVSMGLVAAVHLSSSLGFCDKGILELIEKIISQIGLPTRIPSGLSAASIYSAMKVDKKKKGGKLHFVLLRQVGDPIIGSDISESAVINTLDALRIVDN
jgi:3-dehydroquinate synthase